MKFGDSVILQRDACFGTNSPMLSDTTGNELMLPAQRTKGTNKVPLFTAG